MILEISKSAMNFLKNKGEFVLCEITYLHFYKSFEEMIFCKKTENIVPFFDSDEEALETYKNFPGSQRVKSIGCCAIEVNLNLPLI